MTVALKQKSIILELALGQHEQTFCNITENKYICTRLMWGFLINKLQHLQQTK